MVNQKGKAMGITGQPIERQVAEAVAAGLAHAQLAEVEGELERAETIRDCSDQLARAYAERSGRAYGFIEGLAHKIYATTQMLNDFRTPEGVSWVMSDLEAMYDACTALLAGQTDQLAKMQERI